MNRSVLIVVIHYVNIRTMKTENTILFEFYVSFFDLSIFLDSLWIHCPSQMDQHVDFSQLLCKTEATCTLLDFFGNESEENDCSPSTMVCHGAEEQLAPGTDSGFSWSNV